MKKKIAVVAFMLVMLFSFNAYAYKSASITLGGAQSGSMTINVNDLSGLMSLINNMGSIGNLGDITLPPVIANITYDNFQNTGAYITGGFDITISFNNSMLTVVFSGGPLNLAGTPITFNSLGYTAGMSDSTMSCSGGSVAIAGTSISCAELQMSGVGMELILMVLMM